MKRQSTSGESESAFMTVQCVYLTLQVIYKDKLTGHNTIHCMVQTTLAAQGTEELEEKERDDVKYEVGGRN